MINAGRRRSEIGSRGWDSTIQTSTSAGAVPGSNRPRRSLSDSPGAQAERVLRHRLSLCWAEHPPPHLHTRYGEHRVAVVIATSEVVAVGLPGRAMHLIRVCGELHRRAHDRLGARPCP